MEQKLELFAIVELFGHQRLAGKVTEQTVGSSTFIRIDVPELPNRPKFTRIVNPTAVYAINPVTEEVANITAAQIEASPIDAWDVRTMYQKLLSLKNENNNEEF